MCLRPSHPRPGARESRRAPASCRRSGSFLQPCANQYQQRFEALQKKRQITDRAETLGNFALASAEARDWDQAVAQLKEALQICGDCRSRAALHKNLGLIYCRSGEVRNGERELRVAAKLKPNDPDVVKALEVIRSLVPNETADERR